MCESENENESEGANLDVDFGPRVVVLPQQQKANAQEFKEIKAIEQQFISFPEVPSDKIWLRLRSTTNYPPHI